MANVTIDLGSIIGRGIASAEVTDEYKLKLTFTDGTSWTSENSIRGPAGSETTVTNIALSIDTQEGFPKLKAVITRQDGETMSSSASLFHLLRTSYLNGAVPTFDDCEHCFDLTTGAIWRKETEGNSTEWVPRGYLSLAQAPNLRQMAPAYVEIPKGPGVTISTASGNYAHLAYRKGLMGHCAINFSAGNISFTYSGSLNIFTIPDGFRPRYQTCLPAFYRINGNNVSAMAKINTDGTVNPLIEGGSGTVTLMRCEGAYILQD